MAFTHTFIGVVLCHILIVDEAKHLVAFALATGGHFGLLACGGPGVAEGAPLGKAGFIAKEQQGFALARGPRSRCRPLLAPQHTLTTSLVGISFHCNET